MVSTWEDPARDLFWAKFNSNYALTLPNKGVFGKWLNKILKISDSLGFSKTWFLKWLLLLFVLFRNWPQM
jgi:hypothetical protein